MRKILTLIVFVLIAFLAYLIYSEYYPETSDKLAVELVDLSFDGVDIIDPTSPEQNADSPATEMTPLIIAVIGDYGDPSPSPADYVYGLIRSKGAKYIVTTGDNGYPSGTREDLEKAHKRFQEYVDSCRLLPSLGNHDWGQSNPYSIGNLPSTQFFGPCLSQIIASGNDRYYTVILGNGLVKIIVLSTDYRDPENSLMSNFLREELQSGEPYKFVFYHVPDFSSCDGKNTGNSGFPFAQWGTYPTAVFNGHCHLYERLEHDGLTYFVQGAGGGGQTDFFNGSPPFGAISRWQYNDNKGSIFIEATPEKATISFVNIDDQIVDWVFIDAYTHTAYQTK